MEVTHVKRSEFFRATQAYDANGLDGLIADSSLSPRVCAVVVNLATQGGTTIGGKPVADYIEEMRRQTSEKKQPRYDGR
jgi:hypothetical protein